jgi:hypothetical protein
MERRGIFSRWLSDSGLPSVGVPDQAWVALIHELNVATLEDAAAQPRAAIARVRGVGPTAMQIIENEMARRGLGWTS